MDSSETFRGRNLSRARFHVARSFGKTFKGKRIKMKVAIIGWGSLIWNPGSLLIKGEWKTGPYLPVEFARISRDGRLTLVLYSDAEDVQTMWVYSAHTELGQAIENLRQREETSIGRIGFISRSQHCSQIISPMIINRIKAWAEEKAIDAVIWTDLPSNFKEKTGKDFNEDSVLGYLRSLKGEKLNKAKEYIVNAPGQIDTKVRLRIEAELGWQRKT